MLNNIRPELLLRVGLAFVFLYAGVGSLINPQNWIGFFPFFLRNAIPETTLLIGFSAFEIILSMWILSGKKIRLAAIVASITLSGIILGNLSQLDIVFRDVAMLYVALALAFPGGISDGAGKR